MASDRQPIEDSPKIRKLWQYRKLRGGIMGQGSVAKGDLVLIHSLTSCFFLGFLRHPAPPKAEA